MATKTIRLNQQIYDQLNEFRLQKSAKLGKLLTFGESIEKLLALVVVEK